MNGARKEELESTHRSIMRIENELSTKSKEGEVEEQKFERVKLRE